MGSARTPYTPYTLEEEARGEGEGEGGQDWAGRKGEGMGGRDISARVLSALTHTQ